MDAISSIALSGIQAFTKSLEVTTNNIANVNSTGFTASQTNFQSQNTAGVSASSSSTEDTVDLSKEAVNLLVAQNGIKANIKVLQAANQTSKTALDILT